MNRLRKASSFVRASLALGVLAGGDLLGGGYLHGTAAASDLRRTAIVEAVAHARGAVVNIHGRKTVRDEGPDLGGNWKQVNGMGTGVTLDQRGYILTNFHVVDGVKTIQVSTSEDKSYVARLVAHDATTDLALIKIDPEESLETISLGRSSDLMQGEPVIAVGNAFGYSHTVSIGVISALHRTVPVNETQQYRDLIQTDASINPGNSGGPLLNIDGQMIGLNVAVRVGAQGIGFAIPIDQALEVAGRLMQQAGSERYHGLQVKTVYKADKPICVVESVEPSSPAEAAGFVAGDVLEQAGDLELSRALDWQRVFLAATPLEEVTCSIKRDDEAKQLSLKFDAARPVQVAFNETSLEQAIWETLGLKLQPLDGASVQTLNQRFRGGFQIADVRPNSSAAGQYLQRGDVLVGMHIWETANRDNLAFILSQPEMQSAETIRVLVLRGDKTYYAYIQPTHAAGVAAYREQSSRR
jgi:serine protease Do